MSGQRSGGCPSSWAECPSTGSPDGERMSVRPYPDTWADPTIPPGGEFAPAPPAADGRLSLEGADASAGPVASRFASVPAPAAWPPSWHPAAPPRPIGWAPSGWPASLDELEPLATSAASPSDSGYAPLSTDAGAGTSESPADPRVRRLGPPLRRAALASGAVVVAGVIAAIWIIGSSPWPGHKPADGAVAFLKAVASGDSQAALAHQQETPADRTLLTDEVLRASAERAPITDIRVTGSSTNEVELAYFLGPNEVTATFVPVRQADGTFKIRSGTSTVNMSLPRQVPVTVNGQPVRTQQLQAFPGAYELDTGLTNLTFEETDFTVAGPRSNPRVAPAARLSDEGTREFLTAARASLDACAAAPEVTPSRCPQGQLGDLPQIQFVAGSVQWSLVNDPFQGVTPQLNLSDETVAEVALSVRMHLRAAVLHNGEPGSVDQVITLPTTATGQVASDPVFVSFATAP